MRGSAQKMSKMGAVGAVAVSATLLLAACGGSSSSAPAELDPNADLTKQTLTVSNWAGYYPEDLPAKVQEAIGTPLTIANHATNEEIMGKLTAGGDSGIDVAFVSGQYAQALNDAGLLEPMHPDLIPNLKNLYPEATQMAFDKGNVFSVTERWLMLPALKSLGYSINTTDDAQLQEAKDLLIAAKPNLLAYDDTTFYSRLISGEATMAVAWDGWCNYGIAEDPNIKFVIPKEGSDLWSDTMVVLKSSKNKEAAQAFINFILDPANHAWVSENILYKVPNKAAMEQVGAELAAAYPNMGMSPADLLKEEVVVDVGVDSSKYTKVATEVTSN